MSAITLPYADSLARNGVVNFGAPYPSRKWFEERQPYSWSLFPDGTNVVSATSSAMIGRYPPGSMAEFAGPALRNKPRRFAVIAPENAEYQESMNVLLGLLRDAHIDVATNQKYKLDLASFPNQASNIIAQIKDAGVTSVVCICDPAMLAFGLTPKANEQGYEPEWITAGLVFVDQDVVAQTIDSHQWSHAFGTAYNAVSEPIGGSFPVLRVQIRAAQRRARPRRRGVVLPDVPVGDRHADGRPEPHAAELPGGDVRLPARRSARGGRGTSGRATTRRRTTTARSGGTRSAPRSRTIGQGPGRS